MTVIVLIRRVAREDKLEQFRAAYVTQRPTAEGFISEYLTEVDPNVPSPLRSMGVAAAIGKTFVNVAFWRSADEFNEWFKPQDGFFDADTEVEPRTRLTLTIVGAAGSLPTVLPPGVTLP